MSAARLLISGYYGFDNFGDEAILEIFTRQWRARRPSDILRVLSQSPATSTRFGVEAVPRTSVAQIAKVMKETDVFISGGGGLLQSSTSLRSLLYYTGLMHEAKGARVAAAIFAVVRDEASAQLLHQLLPRADVRVAADPVFLAPESVPENAERRLVEEGIGGSGDLVAVVVRQSRALDKIAAEIAKAVDVLSGYGAQIVFVPFQRPADVEASVSIIRRCRTSPVLLGGGYDLETMTALFKRCTALIGMRLHSLILAARLGVPFAAVPYDPKIVALTESLRYPLSPLQAGTAAELMASLWAQRESLSAHLRDAAAMQGLKASQGFDWLQHLVEGAVS